MSMKEDRSFDYDYYVEMVEKRYFASVDREDMDAVLDCFCEDAVFTIQSDFKVHEGRDTGIKKMFEDYFKAFTWGVHKDFVHLADPDRQCGASQFNVEVEAPDGTKTYMSNANIHFFENGKFKRVYVYMSGGQNTLG